MKKMISCLAILAALLLAAAPPALASSTTMAFEVTNQNGQAVHVETRGQNYNHVTTLEAGGQTSFSDQDTAYFMDPRIYGYNVRIYRAQDNKVLCDVVSQVSNTWALGPRVQECRAHLWGGPCQVSTQRSEGDCQVSITVGN